MRSSRLDIMRPCAGPAPIAVVCEPMRRWSAACCWRNLSACAMRCMSRRNDEPIWWASCRAEAMTPWPVAGLAGGAAKAEAQSVRAAAMARTDFMGRSPCATFPIRLRALQATRRRPAIRGVGRQCRQADRRAAATIAAMSPGVLQACLAYAMWGLLPLYFHLVAAVAPLDIVLN